MSSLGRAPRPARGTRLLAAAAGLVAMLVALAVAEIAAALVDTAASPILAVGAWIVDLAPRGAAETAIRTLGTADKPALLAAVAVIVLAAAACAGLIEARRRAAAAPAPRPAGRCEGPRLHPGFLIFAVIGAIGVTAVLTRPSASPWAAVPAVLGTAGGMLTLRWMLARLPRAAQPAAGPPTEPTAAAAATAATGTTAAAGTVGATRAAGPAGSVPRRSFLLIASGTAIAAVLAGAAARSVNAGRAAVAAARRAVRLPAPAHPAAAVPAGSDLRLPGLTPYVTPASGFYRVDTALQVPAVDVTRWKLRVDGAVEHPFSLDFDQLTALPLTEHMITLACVSNEVGGDLIGNATWLGVPVRELLRRARPKPGTDMVLSADVGGWTAGTPLSVLTDEHTDALLAVGMNGAPLPPEHGFPARMVVPGLYGYVSATKWITRLTVTDFAHATAYWTREGWSAHGPIKLESRIDTPRDGASIPAGRRPIAGIAWAQHIGIGRVQVRVDHGPWRDARLAAVVSDDTWRQWVLPWTATRGAHTIQVRATDASGRIQTAHATPPVPDGASGWHTVRVAVR